MTGQARPPAPESYRERRRMIARQLVHRGIRNRRVLAAMARIPREWFVSPALRAEAYADAPLPIGNGQTISQPFVVALMTDMLAPHRHDRVLEVGAGSGYQTAVLALLCGRVYAVERLPDLLVEAEERFRRLGLTNIETRLGDGAQGWPEAAPFNGVLVAAAAPDVPHPLLEQLAPGGRLVIPIGDMAAQELRVYQRTDSDVHGRPAGEVRFVPLISRLGFTESGGEWS
ncbi:MAG TPA: protein-L-isoaspartate(D-aspartate) O-methyltransferase [Gemmatimonadales bacterium]|nr:protein-L-isoaspartate(D-aspartate) O-methyltransferase [Gemmatimonadales bacterium]